DYLPFAMAIDKNGDVVVVGSSRGVVDFGGGPLTSATLDDVFVVKLDASGKHVWSRLFGDVGGFGATERARAVALDPAGNVYVTGIFGNAYGEGSIAFGTTTHHSPKGAQGVMFLAKLTPDGTPLWSKSFLGAQAGLSSAAMSVSADATGRVVLSG